MDNTNVIIKPLITEKSTHQQTTRTSLAWSLKRIALLRARRRAFWGMAWRQLLGRFCLA